MRENMDGVLDQLEGVSREYSEKLMDEKSQLGFIDLMYQYFGLVGEKTVLEIEEATNRFFAHFGHSISRACLGRLYDLVVSDAFHCRRLYPVSENVWVVMSLTRRGEEFYYTITPNGYNAGRIFTKLEDAIAYGIASYYDGINTQAGSLFMRAVRSESH
jgi:hypothetical protein